MFVDSLGIADMGFITGFIENGRPAYNMEKFTYNKDEDNYICPEGKTLTTTKPHICNFQFTPANTQSKIARELFLPTNKWQDNFSTFGSLSNTQGSSPILLFKLRRHHNHLKFIY